MAISLKHQGAVSRDTVDTTDWGESDVEEMLEALEIVWRDRQGAAAMGTRAAAFMAELNWPVQVNKLIRAIEPLF